MTGLSSQLASEHPKTHRFFPLDWTTSTSSQNRKSRKRDELNTPCRVISKSTTMHLTAVSFLILWSILALELVSPSSTSNAAPHPAVLILQTSAPQPPVPYLKLRHIDLDRRQIQPAAAGAPAAAAAGAVAQPNAGAAAPVAAAKPATTTAPAQAPAAAAAAPAAPAAPAAAGVVGAHGDVPINSGPATALTTAPSPKAGTVGMGTLTGKVGVVKTQEAKSEAVDYRTGFMASWPLVFKVGASMLLGMALGFGILL
ncbi:MAG: hypothetical protein Q9220_000694 [cf. Caloplaca sp. 1 TL-2023]